TALSSPTTLYGTGETVRNNPLPALPRNTGRGKTCRITGMSWLLIYELFGWLIRAAMVPTILRRQFAPGAAMAWLGIIFLHPYIGWVLYMLVVETRLGPNRAVRP